MKTNIRNQLFPLQNWNHDTWFLQFACPSLHWADFHISTWELPLLFIYLFLDLLLLKGCAVFLRIHHHLFNIPLNASNLSLLQAKLQWTIWPNLLCTCEDFFCRANSKVQNCWVRGGKCLTFSQILSAQLWRLTWLYFTVFKKWGECACSLWNYIHNVNV